MRALLLLTLTAAGAWADEPVDPSPAGLIRFVDATLTLPPPARERPKVRVRIEPAPARPKSSHRWKP